VSPLASAVCLFLCPSLSLNEVGEFLLSKAQRRYVRARCLRSPSRAGRRPCISEWKRDEGEMDGLGGEENCLLSRLRLRLYPCPRLSR
jgi:hypothetical protein